MAGIYVKHGVLQVLGFLKDMRLASIVAIAIKLNDAPEYISQITAQFAEEVGSWLDRVIGSKS